MTAEPGPATAIEAVTVRRWRCRWCRRSWSAKSRAAQHAADCWLDPARRTCKTCIHHQPGCQDIDEHCRAGVDMTGKLPDGTTGTTVQVKCPKWETR